MRPRFPSGLLLLLLAVGCSPATPPPTFVPPRISTASPAAGPTATDRRTETPTPLPTLGLPFRLIDTGRSVNEAYGNISWSHDGTRIAYGLGISIFVVEVGRWDRAKCLSSERSVEWAEWDPEPYAIAWSPDDRQIGFTLRKYLEDGVTSVYRMGQVDVETGEMAFLGPEDAILQDWSQTNEVAGYYEESYDLFVLEVATGRIKTVEAPSMDLGPFARWMPDGRLLTKETTNLGGWVYEAEFYTVDWRENRWEPLSIHTTGKQLQAIHPVASPDGRWIAWITDDIVAMHDRRSGQTWDGAYNANGSAAWRALTWAPDSKRLALSAKARLANGNTLWILEPDLPE